MCRALANGWRWASFIVRRIALSSLILFVSLTTCSPVPYHPPPPQLTSSAIDTCLRDDLERLKKIRNHRGLRAYWGLRVRGQHTKTTGRYGPAQGSGLHA